MNKSKRYPCGRYSITLHFDPPILRVGFESLPREWGWIYRWSWRCGPIWVRAFTPLDMDEEGRLIAGLTGAQSKIQNLPPQPYRFDLRQHWEGTIVAVGESEFRATLKDLTHSDSPPEEATFSLEEVFPGDLRRLVPGAVFRWSIGYKTQGSQKERVSRIHFARLPGWSKQAVKRVVATAVEI